MINEHYWKRYLKFIEWCDSTSIWEGELYTEKHHVMPKSFGGDNSSDNLIKLPYRAHLLAHWMLAKAIPCKETAFAFHAMISTPSTHRNEIVNSRTLETCKVIFSEFNRQQTLELWQDSEFRKKQEGKSRKSETRSETYLEKWKDDNYRKMMLKARENSWNDNRRRKQSKLITEVNKKRWSDLENKLKQSQNVKKALANRTEEQENLRKQRLSESMNKRSYENKRKTSLKSNISRWRNWLEQGFSVSKHGKHPLSDEKRAKILDKIDNAQKELLEIA